MTAPSEAQIVEAVTAKLTGSQGKTVPEAELARLLATLELENDWTDVSAKRFHSVLSKNALVDQATTATTGTEGGTSTAAGAGASKKKKKSKTDAGVPRSFIDPSVSIPTGVRAHYFDSVKGKGLVASRSFAEGELVFTEEAYIATPPPEAFGQVSSGELCAQCFLPVSSAPVQLAIKDCAKCKVRWCTSACARTAMATHHTLLCTGLNPAAKPLMQLVQSQKWQSLHCVARSLARLLSTLTLHNHGTAGGKQSREQDDLIAAYGDFETVHARLSSFATVSELERRSRNPGWATEKASFEGILAEAYTALCNALDPYADSRTSSPYPDPNYVQLDLIDAVKTRKGQIKDLFTYASFLKLLGRANVNMEKFGGLYSVHSFLNHSCAPNVQIRHVPERGILASMKVAALALRPIAKDEELVISYIDPSTRLGRRQLVLYRDYCFGPCTCPKCTQELKEVGLHYDPAKNSVKTFLDNVARKSNPDPQAQAPQDPSLEEELRASLGF